MLAVAIVAGFVAAACVIVLTNALLPPFRPDMDDDTGRNFLPVALAYLAWAATTSGIAVFGLRHLRRGRRDAE
jgi:hypothetical protein